MTHTKGPWTAHTYNQRMGSLISFGDLSKGETIGIAYGQENEEEGKANARLIAIAPKLLSAAKSLENWLSAPQSDIANRRIVEDCRAELREAIAEAEGL